MPAYKSIHQCLDAVADMNAARWYPTTTTTRDGNEVLVMTGTIDSVQVENPLPQVWQPRRRLARSHQRAAQDLQLFLGLLDAFRECLRGGPPENHALSEHYRDRCLDRCAYV